jgi:hypothetical protein
MGREVGLLTAPGSPEGPRTCDWLGIFLSLSLRSSFQRRLRPSQPFLKALMVILSIDDFAL